MTAGEKSDLYCLMVSLYDKLLSCPQILRWSTKMEKWLYVLNMIYYYTGTICVWGRTKVMHTVMFSVYFCGSWSHLLLVVTAGAGEPRVLCCWHHGKITSPSFHPTGELSSHSCHKPSLFWLINTPPSVHCSLVYFTSIWSPWSLAFSENHTSVLHPWDDFISFQRSVYVFLRSNQFKLTLTRRSSNGKSALLI